MTLATLSERCFAYGARFSIAVRNLGFGGALRTFVWIRGRPELRSIHVPRLGRRVFFRGSADKGVISHFFYPGTRIHDTPECPVRVIVDAGANAGMETLLNGLWSTDGPLRVLPGTTNEAFSVRPAGAGETADIEAITMNTVLARVGGEIDILKMDIEGTEYEVFLKNTEWASHVKAFIFECPDKDHPGALALMFRTLNGLPFDAFVSGENIVLLRRDTGWNVETTAYL